MSADVAVIGAGVVGASIAYHLALKGARVVLLDRAGPARAPAASWASAGGLRSQGRCTAEREISLLSALRWRSLEAELDADLETGFGGHLHLAETEAEAAVVEHRLAKDAAAGVSIERLGPAEIASLAPALTRATVLGAYTPGDGQAHPARTAEAFAAAATRTRVTTIFGRSASVTVDADRAVLTLDGGDVLAAGRIVLAAGAWSVDILAGLGIDLPLRWRGLQMLLSDIAAPLLGPTVTAVGRNLSLKQSPSGQMMVGGGWLAEPIEGCLDTRPVPANVLRQWAGARAILPAMAGMRIAQSWSGVEAQSIDAMPFVGPAPLNGLYVATGFSNHGFQISPTIGQLVAEDLLAGPQALLAPLRLDRAQGLAPSKVAAFRAEPLTS